MRTTALAIAISLLSAAPGHAILVTFELINRDGQVGFDAVPVGALTLSGLTSTFTASTGVLNSTSSQFGINGPSTSPGDASDLIDADPTGVSESVSIMFSAPVTVTNITLEDFSGSEMATATIGGNANALAPQSGNPDSYDFTSGNTVSTLQSLVLSHVGGNGFSFRSFTVDFAAINVPEVSSALLLGAIGCCALGVGRLRRRSV